MSKYKLLKKHKYQSPWSNEENEENEEKNKVIELNLVMID